MIKFFIQNRIKKMVAFGYISTMDEQSLFAEHLLQFWESMGFDFDRYHI